MISDKLKDELHQRAERGEGASNIELRALLLSLREAQRPTGSVELAHADVGLMSHPGRKGRVVEVELMYPRLADEDGRADAVEVGLCDVRAADSVLVEYDFERDGWIIKQASTFHWTCTDENPDPVCDQDWQEVFFVKAWAREKDRD